MINHYRLYNHEYCNAHVKIRLDENGRADKIELYSYKTRVCGAYLTPNDGWMVFCTGTYSQTTRRQISWFTRKPWQAPSNWKLSYSFFKEISKKCDWGIREATDEELLCIQDLIWQYISNGKLCCVYG